MSLREFLVLLMVCTIWGLHFTVMRTVIGEAGVDPLFYAALRMSLVALLMAPFLRWHPGQMRYVLLAALGFGALNYAFMFPALGMTTASAAAVTIELYMPFSVLLGVLILGERIRAWSVLGIVLAFAGVVIIGLSEPGEAAGPLFVLGLVLMALAAASEAGGAIGVKRLTIRPLQILPWAGLVGAVVLWPLALLLESDPMANFEVDRRSALLGGLFYSAVLATIVSHGAYYWLLSRLPIQVVAPVGLLNTVIGVAGGVLILREPLTPGLLAGITVTLSGVAIILWRSSRKGAGVEAQNTPTPSDTRPIAAMPDP